ncbi:helix-turn-helix domain-containing protein [Streptomyces sp. NBC_01383]
MTSDPTAGGAVAEPVRVRRLTDQEGQRLQQIVRRGSTNAVRYRRAMMLLASAGGNRVPVIAQLVAADENTVRDAIHRFNEIGLACLDPRWAGGRPRLLSDDDEDFVVQMATTRPTKLGQPFTRWSLRKLVAYLRTVHGRVIRIGREALLEGDSTAGEQAAYASWANPIEAHFGPLRQFTIANSNHPNHTVQTRALHAYLSWRNANARHRDVLAAERKERARIRSEKGIRWGGRPLNTAA